MDNLEKAGISHGNIAELQISRYAKQAVKATLEHPEYNPFAKQATQAFFAVEYDSSRGSSLKADQLGRKS